MAGQKKSSKIKKANTKKEDIKRKQAEVQEEENEAEFQKAVLEIRVKELETLNSGLKSKCDYLESQNNVYKTQLEECKEERNDIVNYLQKSLREEQTIVKELEDRLYGTQEARKDDLQNFEQTFLQKNEEYDTMKTKLDKTILELGVKLSSIEEFRIQKVELTKQMEDLRETLNNEKNIFQIKYNELENQSIVYRNKIKKDAIDTLIKIAQDVQKVGKLSLSATVKAAIAANVKLNQELETVSKDNLQLRDSLELKNSKIQEIQITKEILEEENSMVHKKCLQYKNVVEILLDKQVQMDIQIKLVKKIENDLNQLRNIHAKCKTDEEILSIIQKQMDAQSIKTAQINLVDSSALDLEIKCLQNIIIKMAIVTKDLSEAANDTEFQFLKERFKNMLIKLYKSACEIQDLPKDLKSRLIIQLPQISTLKNFV